MSHSHSSDATSIPRCAKHGTHYTDECIGCDACRQVHLLREIITDYAQHDSWRCEHPPHFYFADGPPDDLECACGLVAELRAAGLDDLAEQFKPKPRSDA